MYPSVLVRFRWQGTAGTKSRKHTQTLVFQNHKPFANIWHECTSQCKLTLPMVDTSTIIILVMAKIKVS